MAYTAPTTRSTGDLITAPIWNVDLVDNITFLHARKAAIYISGIENGAITTNASTITIAGQLISGANRQSFYFRVPSDFSSVSGIAWVYHPLTTGTSDIDYSIGFGASGELFDNTNASVAGAGGAVTQDNIELLDMSGSFGGLAADDYVSIRIAYGGTGPALFDMGLWFEYNRT